MSSLASLPPPPGSRGLPVLGETLAFLADGFGFIEQRMKIHGPVFRTNLLMRDTVVIVGADATELFADASYVQRSGALPPNIRTLMGGRSLPTLDGAEHRERKTLVMAAFTREAIAAYVPEMERIVTAYLTRWAREPEIRSVDEFKKLGLEVICRTIIGLEPGPALDEVRRLYDIIMPGFATLPIPLPFTAFTRAKRAVSRILQIFKQAIEQHRASARDDGLSRMLSARLPNGRAATTHETAIELHHVVVAGFIVWAWMVTTVLQLDAHRNIRERLVTEVRAGATGLLSLAALEDMPYLANVVEEVRRMSPVVPVFFGKAREDLAFHGFRIPKGWMVLWGIGASHMGPEIYSTPTEFDPDRFSPGRAEHQRYPCAFAPNGAGEALGHKCAGYEFAPTLLKVFLVGLLRDYMYEIITKDLSWDRTKIPPEPIDGLRLRVAPA